jgi:hypothetical protein
MFFGVVDPQTLPACLVDSRNVANGLRLDVVALVEGIGDIDEIGVLARSRTFAATEEDLAGGKTSETARIDLAGNRLQRL